MTSVEKRKAKYTPDYYRELKFDHKLIWKEVDFVCHSCGNIFHLNKVKPRALPSYCSIPCRMAGLDRVAIGAMNSKKTDNLDWTKITTMILSGKNGPHIAKCVGITLVTLHKHVLKVKGMKVLMRMKENGKKRRREAYLETVQRKKDLAKKG